MIKQFLFDFGDMVFWVLGVIIKPLAFLAGLITVLFCCVLVIVLTVLTLIEMILHVFTFRVWPLWFGGWALDFIKHNKFFDWAENKK